MSDIITARDMLLVVAESIKDREPRASAAIIYIVEKLMRRKHTKSKAPVTSEEMNAEKARFIRFINKVNPEKSVQEIADMFKVNPGRVSEAIAGKWGE
jgi:hypothetical protein